MKIFFNFYKQNKKQLALKSVLINSSTQILKKFNNNTNFFLIKGLNVFILKGQKIFLYSKLHNYFKIFYSFIYTSNNFKKYFNYSDFSYFNEIKSSINDNFFLNNPLNLIKWYLNYFSFMFNFKITNKQTKKPLKTNKNNVINNLQIVFILKKKRNIYFFKWLKRLFLLNYSLNFFNTLTLLLNDVFFNFKNSNLYKYKLSIYKNLLSN